MNYKIPLSVYVVWHPDYIEGASIADNIYSSLCRDTQTPLVRSIGIPVYFRSNNDHGQDHPLKINFAESDYTAVVVLVSGHFIKDEKYTDYLEDIRCSCNESKNCRIFPVSLHPNAYRVNPKISSINFIRAHEKVAGSNADTLRIQTAFILSCIIHEFCRQLMNMRPAAVEDISTEDFAPPPVKLFISHSKHDESFLEAKNFKKFIDNELQLKTFFDANDIGYGYNFGEEIKRAARSSALVVFQSDSYSDREWCRIEVITAKAADCPVVIVNSVQKGEKRTFPYLGNYPSIRLTGDFQRIVDTTLEQVLFNLFTKILLTKQAELFKTNVDFVLPNYPELFSFIDLKKKLKEKHLKSATVVYPDPPLGIEEMTLLNELEDNFHFVTPVTLPTINAATNWQKEKLNFFLRNKNIGISISTSDNLRELGLGNNHLKDITIETARYVLAAGGNLVYGGDMRQGGYTELMFDLLKYYKNAEDLPAKRFFSYLSWPISLSLSDDTETSMNSIVTFKKVSPPEGLAIVSENDYLEPNSNENLFVWAKCLTKMRTEMERNCSVRIFVGGKASSFKGKCPGVLEEFLIAAKENKPIYIIGAYGGVSREIYNLIIGKTSEALSSNYQLADNKYSDFVNYYNERVAEEKIDYTQYCRTISEFGIDKLGTLNGLTIDENARLATTPHIHEMVFLILKGMKNIFN